MNIKKALYCQGFFGITQIAGEFIMYKIMPPAAFSDSPVMI